MSVTVIWERRQIAALSIATTSVTVTVTELNPLHGAADGSTLQEFVRGLAAAVTAWSTNAASG